MLEKILIRINPFKKVLYLPIEDKHVGTVPVYKHGKELDPGNYRLYLSSLTFTEFLKHWRTIELIRLLLEKFLQFDCLRAAVFKFNLKYLHVKNYSHYGNPKSQNNLASYAKMAGGFLDFEIRRFKN